jgi:hypothetical protein
MMANGSEYDHEVRDSGTDAERSQGTAWVVTFMFFEAPQENSR